MINASITEESKLEGRTMGRCEKKHSTQNLTENRHLCILLLSYQLFFSLKENRKANNKKDHFF